MLCVLGLGILNAADPASEKTDPWIGEKRGEVIEMLGAPSKVKGGGASETLIYRFVRVSVEAALPPGIELVAVPGVSGAVGRIHRSDTPEVQFSGSSPDKNGNLVGGSLEPVQSHNVSWNKKDGKTMTSSGDDRSAVLGKCTIKFKLNNGRVSEWSVSPKPKAAKK